MYYPLELTILKSVSKDFNHLVSYFKNDFDMDKLDFISCYYKKIISNNLKINKLKLNSYYYKYIITNKYYGLLDEFKGYQVLFEDGLVILSLISNDLKYIKYFINNPLITHDPEIITYKPESKTTIILDFNCSIMNFVLYETTNEYVKNFLIIKRFLMYASFNFELNETMEDYVKNFTTVKKNNLWDDEYELREKLTKMIQMFFIKRQMTSRGEQYNLLDWFRDSNYSFSSVEF
jgi:hypothetical protein